MAWENVSNAGEKTHQRAGVKQHHGWMPNALTGGLLLRDSDSKSSAFPVLHEGQKGHQLSVLSVIEATAACRHETMSFG